MPEKLLVWIPASWNTIFLAKKSSGGLITPNFGCFTDFFRSEAKITVFGHFWPLCETRLSRGDAPGPPECAHYFFYIFPQPKNSGKLNRRPRPDFGLPQSTIPDHRGPHQSPKTATHTPKKPLCP